MALIKAVNGNIVVFASCFGSRPGEVYARLTIDGTPYRGAEKALYLKPEEARRLAHTLLAEAAIAGSVPVAEPVGSDW